MTFKSMIETIPKPAELARSTPVTQAIPGREAEMVQNSGGGFSFKVNDWTMLDRFLIIGTSGGTYSTSEVGQNAQAVALVTRLLAADGIRVVDRCIAISQAGRAKNNDYALYVLALAMSKGDVATRTYTAGVLPLVARTGTHLFHFVAFTKANRGWGSVFRNAIANWYQSKRVADVAYQAIKYQQRDGWSQRDLIKLSHPKAGDDLARSNTYRYIVKGYDEVNKDVPLPQIIEAFEEAKTATKARLINLITDHRLSQEMIPNEMKNDRDVWAAMYPHMGTTALIRNLNKMTAIGLIAHYADITKDIVQRLNSVEVLKRDRIHPLQMLIAGKQYGVGRGALGSLTWTPVTAINQALESGLYQSFEAIEPSNKNMMLCVDVSGSMSHLANGVPISCREAAAIQAMVTARKEPNSVIFGFDQEFRDLGIRATDNLAQVCVKTNPGHFGKTNPTIAIQHAQKQGWKIDCFSVYTDNDINCGDKQPAQALQQYRKVMGVPEAKLVCVGMQMNNVSIADPTDRGMIDVTGFDTQAPRFISDFAAGLV